MNIEKMTISQLKALADQMGITVPAGAKKADIMALIEAEAAQEEREPEQKTPTKEAAQEEPASYQAYVGPPIPGGLLQYGKILYGTRDSIREYLAPVLENYPAVESLLVPMGSMASAMKDVKNPKKLLYHKAQELVNETKKRNGG